MSLPPWILYVFILPWSHVFLNPDVSYDADVGVIHPFPNNIPDDDGSVTHMRNIQNIIFNSLIDGLKTYDFYTPLLPFALPSSKATFGRCPIAWK